MMIHNSLHSAHRFAAIFVLVWCCCFCLASSTPANSKSGRIPDVRYDSSETIALMRIPTGSRHEARRVERELDRAGLGLYFDRSRVLSHMEAALPLQKLVAFSKNTDSLFRAAIPDWYIVRNLTRNEPSSRHRSGAAAPRNTAGAEYLPIHKNTYHSTNDLEHTLRALTHAYPDRAELRTIGRSTRGANIWNLELGTRYNHANSTPHVLLMGSLHGDDVLGTEFCLWLAEYLCREYATSSAVRFMMDKMSIQLIPMPNPDSASINMRYTTKGIDLDRAFPDRINRKFDSDFIEKEVQVLMDWVKGYRPIAGGAILGGGGAPGPDGLVARYSWNAMKYPHGVGEVNQHTVSRAVDDRAFRYLARSYAMAHPTMAKEDTRPLGIDRGLVNGAKWYHRYGSFQDWFYNAVGAPYLEFVVSPYLKPAAENLHQYWEDNKGAAVAFIQMAGEYGMRGTVVDAATGVAVPHAKVMVRDINDRSRQLHPIQTNTNPRFGGHGNFARFMVPGRYSVRAEAPGYTTTDERMFQLTDKHPKTVLRIDMQSP